MVHQKLKLLDDAISEALTIFESTATWKIKYDLIFGMRIDLLARDVKLWISWIDPEHDYQDDITAYVDGLKQLRSDLGNLVQQSEAGGRGEVAGSGRGEAEDEREI